MWCSNCRQDVPAWGAGPGRAAACARCGATLGPAAPKEFKPASRSEHPAECGFDLAGAAEPPVAALTFDDWQLEQNLRSLQARIGRGLPSEPRAIATPAVGSSHLRFDAAHRSAPSANRPPAGRKRRGSPLAWCILSLGLMAFACGAVLLGWSLAQDRPELWKLGMPIAVGGQVGLLLGLVLQLERVWQTSRDAVHKLEHVDSQLDQLERTATMLGVTHGSAAQAFYAHMADQASPQVLLADLKGQLDLLAASMARRSA